MFSPFCRISTPFFTPFRVRCILHLACLISIFSPPHQVRSIHHQKLIFWFRGVIFDFFQKNGKNTPCFCSNVSVTFDTCPLLFWHQNVQNSKIHKMHFLLAVGWFGYQETPQNSPFYPKTVKTPHVFCPLLLRRVRYFFGTKIFKNRKFIKCTLFGARVVWVSWNTPKPIFYPSRLASPGFLTKK